MCSRRRLFPTIASSRLPAQGSACLAVLVWIIAAGPGYLGYGASLLWTGPKKNAAPLYAIAVKPGNITVRRNSDQLVVARVTGMQPGKAQLFAHYQSAAGLGNRRHASRARLRRRRELPVCPRGTS